MSEEFGEEFSAKNRKIKRGSHNLATSLYLIILAFFIVLCRFSTVDATRVALVNEGINDHFFRFTKESRTADGALSPYFYKIYTLLRQLNTNVTLVGDRLTVSLNPSVFYKYGTNDIRREYNELLRQIAETIKENNLQLSRVIYYIHTGSVTVDAIRAENFAKKMISFGLDPDNVVLSISERGEEMVRISFITVGKNSLSKV